MILQALIEYYDRKAADPDSDIAPEGFEKKAIPFIVVIKPDGQFVKLEDTREQEGNRLVGKPYLLPRSQTRSGSRSYEKTFLLWDHIGYLFKFSKTNEQSDIEKAVNQHQTWLNSLSALPDELKKDEGVKAVLSFYNGNGIEKVLNDPVWAECTRIPSCNVTFKIAGEQSPIPCRPKIQEYVRSLVMQGTAESKEELKEDDERVFAHCLVTGVFGEIARTHGRTSINKDTKSLVSFQKYSGYDSYGKEQGYNAPVCKSAEFAYTTALNILLKTKGNRMQVGDAATVFWATKEEDTEFEQNFGLFFNPPPDDPDKGVMAVKSLYTAIINGSLPTGSDRRFYVLGLSPNAARISVRFWVVDTVTGMAGKIQQHFDDMQIVHGPKDREYIPIFRLLASLAVQGKAENIPPNLAGDTMRAILEGLPYPQTLLGAAIRRIRAEREVTYYRAALIKACLNRANRFYKNNKEKEMNVSLDISNPNIGYRLGRLFATLERIQIRTFTQGGGKEPNSTIRDKYYGAASSTPNTVFGTLIRLSKHHLSKLENIGEKVNFEKLLGVIIDDIADFPPHLKLDDQGRFAIGYYHQMQDFFTQKSDNK